MYMGKTKKARQMTAANNIYKYLDKMSLTEAAAFH